MLWGIVEPSPRGERQHECGAAKSHPSPTEFEEKHGGLYVPIVGGGATLFFERGEWVLAIGDEFGLTVSHCPFCGEHLK